ncbi:MAG: hybrid sensor histidine kinase/response regulator [Bacteroidales bacterium]|nr:hybrid sensor histidine kinase/response regulator [Bacteroidales bacterium]
MMMRDSRDNIYIPNILIVDDIPANLVLLGHILRNIGYKVRPVPNGELALKVAEREKPDLIFLDIMMPDMDGFEVCRLIKENSKLSDIPVIFISALNETEDIVKALTCGGADFITKPFKAEEVKARAAIHLKLYMQNKELLKANAEKDKFFSIIAHDLRSPFSCFLGMTQTLEEILPDLSTEEILSFAKSMRSSATNLFRLLENLLEWSRIQQGLIPFEPEVRALLPIAKESLSIIYESAQKKGIEIVLDIPQELNVITDKNMILTVFRNLISNAVKFTPKGGKVTVSAIESDTGYAEISVADTGIGMPPTIKNNIFRPDVKTNREGTDGEASTGLGLLLCREFIERNQGTISVESEDGVGSVFTFTVPLAKI